MVFMRILFFGSLGDSIGREIEVEIPGHFHRVAELRLYLAELFPAAREALANPSVRACIGDEIVGEDHPLGGDEVHFLPPLSGG